MAQRAERDRYRQMEQEYDAELERAYLQHLEEQRREGETA